MFRGTEVIHTTDLDLTAKQVAEQASPDALAAWFSKLGYQTDARTALTPESIGLAGESAAAIKRIELLSEDPEQFLRVVFAQPKSLTAKVRNDLVRTLGKSNIDHLLVLASNFDTLEFVFLDKRKREARGPVSVERIQVVPKIISVNRRSPTRLDLRILRRFTWTCRDGLEQFDKLRTVFDAAAYTGEYFQNRGLFADHYLRERLREEPVWRDNPSEMFAFVRDLLKVASAAWAGQGKDVLRKQLFESVLKNLGFNCVVNRPSKTEQTQPDYLLKNADGAVISAAFVYPWDRWLDGPDLHDDDTPEENPGACVVTALDQGTANWIIVTNGRLWRLYGRQAHARSTNFYEVDLVEALTASGDTDPNEAFRFWWLFFRSQAFAPAGAPESAHSECWLDEVLRSSRDYAKRLGDRLKERVFVTIFPHLAQGFLEDRRKRLGIKGEPSDEELADVFEATLTLLYRLLFLLYAESRDLLPIRESAYFEASLKRIKEEICEKAGVAESDVPERLQKAYSSSDTATYDRLCRLFQVMDKGDAVVNVPTYNGGLFNTSPGKSDDRDHHIARFLVEHKIPDRHLAFAIDRLARDQDERTLGLVFIDYKSLEVRHLGSIYEGLLEFKLRVAEEDLTTQADKKGETYIPLSQAKPKRGKQAAVVVRKKEVYLSNEKAERKASGSYYTPDPIVEYIVANTVGPVLEEKLESLRPEFRKVRKTFDNELQKARAYPPADVRSGRYDDRQWAGLQTYNHHRDLVEGLFDLKVVDPAMGSGHFLVEVVDFVTDRLLSFLNQFPINPVTFALERTRASILESLGEQGVTVDPAKLTDINLLKRHVLKRCVYGVDLNPMAVELAKVSLWLDAFTLGAPLSFLDHHLRCGNSLIGATFAQLEAATKDRLFTLDYEPLLRAINHVLFVSKMADATAAEVAKSVDEYAEARRNLAGYQIILDLLVAQHFGFPKAAKIVEHGDDVDLSGQEKLLESLHDDNERKLVAEVEALALRPDRRFFHWETEFPEVFFGFFDANQRQIKHKDVVEAGSAGFDCVVGNPPYVRQETIKPIKDYLKTTYSTFDSTNDLYVYFQEREITNLRVGGRMGMIVANKWMRAGYGERVRGFLRHAARPLEIIDFGHTPIFPDADTFPCMLIVERRSQSIAAQSAPPDGESLLACPVPREHWHERMDLGAFVKCRQFQVPTVLLRPEGWSLEDPRIQTLFEKIRSTGVPLREFCGSSPLYGIKSGLNDAFYIDAATRERLVREDRRSDEIIKPLVRGRDINRWRPRQPNTFLIFARRGIEIDRYPAIKRHLQQFRDRLEPKPSDWPGLSGKWPGRASGSYRWCELQASPSEDFERALSSPKIVYQEIQFHCWYALETEGAFVNNKVFLLPTDDLALLGVLCSPLMWWHLTRALPHMKDEALSPAGFVMEHVNVTTGTEPQAERLRKAVEPLLALTKELHDWELASIEAARKTFNMTDADDRLLHWLPLTPERFVSRCKSLMDGKRVTEAAATALRAFQEAHRSQQVHLLNRQLALEQELTTLAEDAYSLTAEERVLLRATRPIRDPLDVLEQKIRGRALEAV